jgi:hypothetical protein
MTEIKGTIVLNDNTTVTGPGAVTPQDNNPGGTTTAANPFANTKWKAEVIDTIVNGVEIKAMVTFSFGTDTWSFVQISSEGKQTAAAGGTYTVSGNTATLSGDVSCTATISGNVLTVDGFPTPLTKVN